MIVKLEGAIRFGPDEAVDHNVISPIEDEWHIHIPAGKILYIDNANYRTLEPVSLSISDHIVHSAYVLSDPMVDQWFYYDLAPGFTQVEDIVDRMLENNIVKPALSYLLPHYFMASRADYSTIKTKPVIKGLLDRYPNQGLFS